MLYPLSYWDDSDRTTRTVEVYQCRSEAVNRQRRAVDPIGDEIGGGSHDRPREGVVQSSAPSRSLVGAGVSVADLESDAACRQSPHVSYGAPLDRAVAGANQVKDLSGEFVPFRLDDLHVVDVG